MASTNAYYSDLAVPRSGSPTPWGSPHPLPTRRHPPPKVPLWPRPVWRNMLKGRPRLERLSNQLSVRSELA